MSRPPTVCSDVPSTSRTITGNGELPFQQSQSLQYSGESSSAGPSSKQPIDAPPHAIGATARRISSDSSQQRKVGLRKMPIIIDSSFDEYSDESYRSSDEESDEYNEKRRDAEDKKQYAGELPNSTHSLEHVSRGTSTLERRSARNISVMQPQISNEYHSSISSSDMARRSINESNSTTGNCFGRGRTFCFGLLMIHSTFFTFFVFDLLLLSHSIVFTVTNYLNGEIQFKKLRIISADTTNRNIINIGESTIIAVMELPYNLLLPLFATQIFWLIAGLTAIMALKLVQPLLQLPYILMSSILMAGSLWLVVRCTVNYLHSSIYANSSLHLALLIVALLGGIIFLAQLYFLYVKIICIRALLRKRNTVVSSIIASNNIPDAEASLSNLANISETIGRSRVIGASAALAAVFHRNRGSNNISDEQQSDRRKRENCCSSTTLTTISDEKLANSTSFGGKKPVDADCCSCASCCCDDTYSTKSTIVITDDNDEIRHHIV